MNMMFPSLYEELELKHYVKLAVNLLPQSNVVLALCDESRQIVWLSNENKTLAEFIENSEPRHYITMEHCGCDYVERKHNAINVIYFHLGELAGRNAGELVFYDIGDDVAGEHGADQVIHVLCSIAEIVKAELYYLYEVTAMAKELGERYDELSMLRASDLEMTEYRESRHILSTYIRSCAVHLNADYAAIWIPSRQSIYPGGVKYEHESTETLSLLQRLSETAYEMFQNGHKAFGVNHKDVILRDALKLPDDWKVLAIPVFSEMNKPCGVMLCLNNVENEDFTNSHKATLEAVAHKTYKYIASTRDEITGLLNRQGFEESLWREMSYRQSESHLVLININQFKVVNAAYGMKMGDILLASIAEIISIPRPGIKFAARFDADVFAMLIESPISELEERIGIICDEIDNTIFHLDEKEVTVKCRAGAITLNSKETTIADHLYAAELAISNAKEEDNKRVVIYQPGNAALIKRKNQLTQVENIKRALSEDRFELYCQLIQPLNGNKIHYEILIRMIDESGAIVFPDQFIPVAERYNLMNKVDRWVIKHTFELLSKEEYRELSFDYKWGINLSGMSIGDEDFHDYVSDCLREYNIPPTNIYFEITETAAIKNFNNCISFMNKIHSLGVQFALDDFGSGLSSFSYLKRLSIDYIKIDGSLVKDIVSSKLDQTMVSAISAIARVLGVKTIAEYVENEAILDVLNTYNIDYAQGYGIMKPQSAELELKSLVEYVKCKHCSNK